MNVAVLWPGIRTRWLGAAACAAATAGAIAQIALGGYNQLPGRDAAVPLPMESLGSRPVLQLELARSDADVAAILATSDESARTMLMQNLRAGNRLDSFVFIPAYTLLLAALTLLIQRGREITSRRIFIAVLCAIAAIALFDALEAHGRDHRLHPTDARPGYVTPADRSGPARCAPVRHHGSSPKHRAGARAPGKKRRAIRPDPPNDEHAVLERANADYETLRRYVLDVSRGDRKLGFDLLIRRGMPASIRAWSVCPVPPCAAGGSERGVGIALPEGVRGEVTRLLVTMALGANREETRP